MASDTTVTDFLGDRVHDFKLPIAQLEELQERTKVGPMALLARMLDGSWSIRDVTETVRLGLIGGGMPPAEAHTFIGRYVDQQPLNASLGAAIVILSATISGRKIEETEGNGAAAMSKSDPDQTGSTSPRSDATRPFSESGRSSSKRSRSGKSKKR